MYDILSEPELELLQYFRASRSSSKVNSVVIRVYASLGKVWDPCGGGRQDRSKWKSLPDENVGLLYLQCPLGCLLRYCLYGEWS